MGSGQRLSGMRAGLILALLLGAFCSVYEYGRVLNLRPQPMHLWRQSDCLALTLQYARGEGTFMEPAILSQIADKGTSGKSAGELPLLYFLMGKLWSVIGQSEFAYRLFGLLMHVAGTFALFGAVRRVVRSDLWAIATALLFFTSPVVVYYGIAFLPDVPAFDLALIGWYALVRFAGERRHRWWFLAAACFGLATLLKVTAGMSFVALVALLVLATVRPAWLGEHRRLLPDLLPGWAAVGVVLASVLGWYGHAEVYNDAHGGRYTFNNLWPIWEMSPEKVEEAWRFAKDVLVFQVFDTSAWILFGVAAVVLLMHLRQLPRAVVLLNLLLIMGAAAYIVLWFNALLFHDYYFINPQIMLVVLWVTFLWWLHTHHADIAVSRWARWSMGALVLFNLAHAANNMHMRYNEGGPLMRSSLLPLYHDQELPYWNTISYGPMSDLPTITPFLREHGVMESDKVIFLDDASINASLYLMGQPGYTRFGWELDSAATYDRLIGLGAKYLLFAEGSWLERPFLRPYLRRPLGQYGAVRLFDLQGLDRMTADTLRLSVNRLAAMATQWDTVPGSGTELRFTGTKRPLLLSALVADTAAQLSAELKVRGRIHWEGGACPGIHLVFEERDERMSITHRSVPLVEGAFALDVLVPPRNGGVRNTLSITNGAGLPFTLEELVVEVVRHREVP